MQIFAHVTCDKITEDDWETGIPGESGWVNYIGSKAIFESRNYVMPIINLPVDHEDLPDEIAALHLERADDNGDGTFYFDEGEEDLETGTTYRYAVHFTQKYNGPRGWVERAWHPGEY